VLLHAVKDFGAKREIIGNGGRIFLWREPAL
jgi:hypothetical protein